MAQYIDKSALIAEIERIDKSIGCDRFLSEYEKGCNQGKEETCDTLRNFLDTLEEKKVDLEKEIHLWMEENTCEGYCSANIRETAEHFFELGLKAQKGE